MRVRVWLMSESVQLCHAAVQPVGVFFTHTSSAVTDTRRSGGDPSTKTLRLDKHDIRYLRGSKPQRPNLAVATRLMSESEREEIDIVTHRARGLGRRGRALAPGAHTPSPIGVGRAARTTD